jgi:hypothetical protein
LKKQPGKVTIGTAIERNIKKGNSTQKNEKGRSAPRFYEIKFRIPAEDFARGQPYFQEQKYLARFILDAYREKVNRSESYDKAGRLRAMKNNMDLFLPILKTLHAEGKLDFLRELLNG